MRFAQTCRGDRERLDCMFKVASRVLQDSTQLPAVVDDRPRGFVTERKRGPRWEHRDGA